MTGLEHRHLAVGALVIAALALAVATASWWLYFDESAAAAKRGLLDAGELSRRSVHDVYLFAHLPLSLALVALAVGLEQMVATDSLGDAPSSARWLVAGGTAKFLVSAGLLQSALLGRASALFPAGAAGLALAAVALPGSAPCSSFSSPSPPE